MQSVEAVNEVHLIGRLSGPAVESLMPSGDAVVNLRVVVPRDPKKRRTPKSPTIDTIDVTCWTAASRRRALGLRPDDAVEIVGSLRRRFYRSPGGPASRYDVEVTSIRKASTPA